MVGVVELGTNLQVVLNLRPGDGRAANEIGFDGVLVDGRVNETKVFENAAVSCSVQASSGVGASMARSSSATRIMSLNAKEQ